MQCSLSGFGPYSLHFLMNESQKCKSQEAVICPYHPVPCSEATELPYLAFVSVTMALVCKSSTSLCVKTPRFAVVVIIDMYCLFALKPVIVNLKF